MTAENLTLMEVHKFLRRTGLSESRFGQEAACDGNLLRRLRRGAVIGPELTARVRAWMDQ